MHQQHNPARAPARPHTMVHLEIRFPSGPSCAASARAPLSASLGCVQGDLHGAAARDLTVIIYIVEIRCGAAASIRGARG